MNHKFLILAAVLSSTLSSAAFANSFATIAYNSATRHWTEVHSAHNLGLAQNEALASCGGGCEIVSWVEDGYVVLALGASGWGTANSHLSLADAEGRAVENCSAHSVNCHVVVWAGGF